MKRSIGIGAVILLIGCSVAPVSYYGVAPPGRDDAYECALAQLNIMGYTIEDGNKDAGFIRASKQTSGLGTQILTGSAYHDLLTATTFTNPATDETNLRVVASRIADQDIGLLGGLSDDEPAEGMERVAPSDSGKEDALALLANCGVTNVIGPPAEQGEGASAGDR
jgi:hypothetical protein